MIQSFFIPGPLPGMNEIVAACNRQDAARILPDGSTRKKRWSAYNNLKQGWNQIIRGCARRYQLRPMPYAYFLFDWREEHERRDPDNVAAGQKFIFDGLVDAGILPGDGWKHVRGFNHQFQVDKKNPGVMVTMSDEPIGEDHGVQH